MTAAIDIRNDYIREHFPDLAKLFDEYRSAHDLPANQTGTEILEFIIHNAHSLPPESLEGFRKYISRDNDDFVTWHDGEHEEQRVRKQRQGRLAELKAKKPGGFGELIGNSLEEFALHLSLQKPEVQDAVVEVAAPYVKAAADKVATKWFGLKLPSTEEPKKRKGFEG